MQLGVLVWIAFAFLGGLFLLGIISIACLLRRITAMWADERGETHNQRQPADHEHCWVSPDEESKFEEITGPLGVELEARRQARYGDDGPRLTLGGGPC
jgi:hypothetical protein